MVGRIQRGIMIKIQKKYLSVAIACVASTSLSSYGVPYENLFLDRQEYNVTDPLYSMQWHLNNTEQRAAADNKADRGNDINVTSAHVDKRVLGESVKVAVIDSGLAIRHEDLADNIVPNRSKNYIRGAADPSDPTPPSSDTGGDHGTSVAGLIAARGFNDLGGRGVAPLAQLMGFNWLENQTFEFWIETHGGKGVTDDARVINQSYGSSPIWPTNFESIDNEAEEDHLSEITATANNKKGIAFIKSAGNSFRSQHNVESVFSIDQEVQHSSSQRPQIVTYTPHFLFSADSRDPNKTQLNSLPAQISGSDPSNSSFYHVTISALSANESRDPNNSNIRTGDVLSSYSSVGSSVWVSAHGGEYGETYPAMVTTDIEGCDRGYSRNNSDRDFNAGRNPLNSECNYTSTFNGTSSAAPLASGVFALLFDANPDLTWRDAKDILAKTATKVGANFDPITVETGSGKFVAEPGWIKNSENYEFHNWYGFGRINASAAVNMALSDDYDLLPSLRTINFTTYSGVDEEIPEGVNGLEQSLNINTNITIEAVQLKFSIEHDRDTDLAVELISPAGTSSMLVTPRSLLVLDQGNRVPAHLRNSLDTQTDFDDTVFLTNAFYGERSAGEWTIKVTDTNSGEFLFYGYRRDTQEFTPITTENNRFLGLLTDWSIRIYGH